MREPKKGDRCEFARWDSKLSRNIRECSVRHMEGKPPGQLAVRLHDGKSVLVCFAHAMELGPTVRKQRRAKVRAEQIDLVTQAAIPCYPNPEAKSISELFPMRMPGDK